MTPLPLLLLSLGLIAGVATGATAGCVVCGFGPDQASQAQCVPRGGLVGFNSLPPATPAYWTLHANRRAPRGRLRGRLTVWSDYTAGPPQAPGLPPTCDGENGICFGTEATFRARIRGDRLQAVARYPDGTRCDFDALLAFGTGSDPPNTWRCQSATGTPVGDGPLQLQMLRLLRCRR